MPWNYVIDKERDIITAHLSGYLTVEDIGKVTLEVYELAPKDRPARFLLELRDAEFEHSVADISDMPREWHRMEFMLTNRVALLAIDCEEIKLTLQFFEMTCRSQGWQLALFTEREKAMTWLLEEPALSPATA